MIKYQTSEDHYRIAEKFLGDEQQLVKLADQAHVRSAGARLRELAQIHASLAAVGITREDVDRMVAEDEAEMDRLRGAHVDRLLIDEVTTTADINTHARRTRGPNDLD